MVAPPRNKPEPTRPIVGGNGLSNTVTDRLRDGLGSRDGRPSIVGGNGTPSSGTTTRTRPDRTRPIVGGNVLSDNTESDTETGPETERAGGAAQVLDVVSETGASEHIASREADTPPTVQEDPAPQLTQLDRDPRDRSTSTVESAETGSRTAEAGGPVERVTNTVTAAGSERPVATETVTLTTTSASTPVSLAAPNPVAEAALPDVAGDIAPLLGALVLRGLPPVGPGPTPPVAPLTWAATAFVRRNSEMARTQVETPPAQLDTTSLTSTGIAGLDSFFQQQAAGFNQKFHNQTPTATPTDPDYHADGTVTGSIGGADPDGDRLTYTVTDPPEHGTVVVNADGTYTYTPDADTAAAGGPDEFTVTVSDNTTSHSHGSFDWYTGTSAHTTTATIELNTNPVNQAPGQVSAVVDSTDADTGTITGHFTATDPNPGDTVTYSVTAPPTRGSLVVDAETGAFTYTPDDDARYAAGATGANTVDTFEVTATDGLGAATATELGVVISPTDEYTTTSTSRYAGAIFHSPDGEHTLLVSTSSDGTSVAVVDIATGEVSEAHTQPGTVFSTSVKFDAAGDRVYVVTRDTTTNNTYVSAIDVETGEATPTQTLAGSFLDVEVTADGDHAYVVVGDFLGTAPDGINTMWDSRIYIVDGDTGVATLAATQTGNARVLLAGDGERAYIVAVANDRSKTFVTVLVAETGAKSVTIEQDGEGSLAVAPDGGGAVLVTYTHDGTEFVGHVSVLDADGGRVGAEFDVPGVGASPQYTPDGRHAYLVTLTGSWDAHATFIDTDTGAHTTVDQPGQGHVYLSGDGERAVLVTFNGNSTFTTAIDLETGTAVGTTTVQTGSSPTVTFSADGDHAYVVASTSFSGPTGTTSVTVVDTATGVGATTTDIPGKANRLVVLPDGEHAYLSVSYDDAGSVTTSVVRISTDGSQETVATVPGTTNQLQSGGNLLVSSDGAYVVLTTTDAVTIIDTATQDDTTIDFTDSVDHVAFSPDGSSVLVLTRTSASNTTITIIDAATGEPTDAVEQTGTRRRVEFSSDGENVYVTTRSGPSNALVTTVAVYDADTGTRLGSVDFAGNAETDVVDIDGDEYVVVEFRTAGGGTQLTLIRNLGDNTDV